MSKSDDLLMQRIGEGDINEFSISTTLESHGNKKLREALIIGIPIALRDFEEDLKKDGFSLTAWQPLREKYLGILEKLRAGEKVTIQEVTLKAI